MEEQKGSAQHFDRDSDVSADTQPHPPRPFPLSSSEPTLRFPRPQGNRHLASWISSSQPDIMSPSADSSGEAAAAAAALSESTFEFIHTDDESQDGPASESLDSFDYNRSDDVHSLAGTEHSADDLDTDSESGSDDGRETGEEEAAAEEDEEARNTSQVYVEESLSSPSTPASASIIGPATGTPLIAGSATLETWESQDPMQSKHVSVDDSLVGQNDIPGLPQSRLATVHLQMDEQCLRIKDPVRITYVGSLAVQKDIINKLVSALTAPSWHCFPKSDKAEFQKTHIKVEHCTSAQETTYVSADGATEKMCSITINGKSTYRLLAHKGRFRATGTWSAPDFAVFYASEDDDVTAWVTRDAAWQFMKQHCVPCILISDPRHCLQPVNALEKYIDGHAIHRRLDTDSSNSSARLLPVDLTSFLNVNAGELNRHLAYLSQVYSQKPEEENRVADLYTYASKATREIRKCMLGRRRAITTFALLHFLLFGITTVAVYNASQFFRGTTPTPAAPGTVVQQPLTSAPPVASTSVSQHDPVSTASSNQTSTTIVEIPRANAYAAPSHLALVPFSNLFPESATGSQESAVCSVVVHGRNEILVKIPLSTKTTWLAKDSISIDVLRGDKLVKTKFSSIDEGLLIEIPRSQAYGPISVTVITSRKPKVNETFEVDFGKSIIEAVVDFGRHMVDGLTDAAGEAPERFLSMKDSLLEELTDLAERARAETSVTVDYIRDAWSNSGVMGKQWGRIQNEASRQLRYMEDYSDRMDLSILRAQIASRLWWLRFQGKQEEYDVYRRKAKVYLAHRYSDAAKARQLRHQANAETSSEGDCRSWRWSKKCWFGDK